MQQPLWLFLPPLPSFHLNAQLLTAPNDLASDVVPDCLIRFTVMKQLSSLTPKLPQQSTPGKWVLSAPALGWRGPTPQHEISLSQPREILAHSRAPFTAQRLMFHFHFNLHGHNSDLYPVPIPSPTKPSSPRAIRSYLRHMAITRQSSHNF